MSTNQQGSDTETKRPTHYELVKALLKPGTDILASMTPPRADALHNIVGISGELGELSENVISSSDLGFIDGDNLINLVEELGDFEFYLCGLSINYGYTPEITSYIPAERTTVRSWDRQLLVLTTSSGKLIDLVKKQTIYNQDISVEAVHYVLGLVYRDLVLFVDSCNYHNHGVAITREDVLNANIDKLMKRYSTLSYSDTQAQVRADKVEESTSEEVSPSDEPCELESSPATSVEDIVVGKIRSRGEVGRVKYGTTLDRKDLSPVEWITHLQEELLDASQYAERVIGVAHMMDEAREIFTRILEGYTVEKDKLSEWVTKLDSNLPTGSRNTNS